MLQAFIITLREGLEAFLIVGISLSYLRKSGWAQLARAVHWGVVASLGLSGRSHWRRRHPYCGWSCTCGVLGDA
jgi:hypothetical protein